MLVAAFAAFSLYALGFGIFLAKLPAAGSGTAATADGIVALTGEGDRLAPAVTLLENGHAKRLLITGVNRLISKTYLKKLLRAGETFDCCADLGFAALDTRGNAQEAADWVRAHRYASLVVVTADYHMPRTLVEFGAALPGVRLVPYPVADPPETLSWQSAKRLNGEYAKYLASVVHASLVRFSQAA
jgi:uncharacterized SAM-binding protein YcdF (DUF218 family)